MIIHRHFSAERFQNFLDTNTLSLTQICHWNTGANSQKEGIAFNYFFTKIRNYYALPDIIYLSMLYGLKNAFYAQCWTISPESNDMWKKFSTDNKGVRVSIDSEVVYKSIRNSLLSEYEILDLQNVVYESQVCINSSIFEENTDLSFFATHFLDKSYEFEYEKESRYIAFKRDVINNFGEIIKSKSNFKWDTDDFKKILELIKNNSTYINYDIDSSQIIEVIADSRMSTIDYNKLVLSCQAYGIFNIKRSACSFSMCDKY